MPIYEFACPKCRTVFSFLSKRVNPEGLPSCPKCGNKEMTRQISRFSMTRGLKDIQGDPGPKTTSEDKIPGVEDPRIARAMGELERQMERMDESNPRHLAHMMRKMKEMMPSGALPKEMDIAIKRLEAGEDPEKIEEDMGDLLADFSDDDAGAGGRPGGAYHRDSGLYDY